ncbi:PaaI family thioesterase [Cupriavidus numazuensis]|uniref:Thioesterase domain-containing protein n=1 Tax=Cupriavidus numazuensis TaxID=221992 RepID=A0ABN7Q7J0_9BURK|nr:PaaI family thioesterase [Cupriavidus numazuensis]CAG2157298.1 hypothetical protein LMG26411_05529 [Cupriavidus numazuensis]
MTNYRYGVASPAEIAEMSGKAVLEAIIDGRLPQPPISQILGFRLTEVGDGFAVFEGDPGTHLFNPMGTVHGGWALTLIDSATACAANSVLPAGTGYTTVETRGNFSRPIKADTGRVRAEGRVINQGRQIITAEARVLAADGRILAHGSSTLLVLASAK